MTMNLEQHKKYLCQSLPHNHLVLEA